jgi:ABC-type multidrug transport system ATPase subunit
MQLVLDKLSKRYPGGVQALRDVSLTIGPGLFGLLGPNGAGKSTLMRTLATLQEVDSGTARLGDIDDGATDPTARSVDVLHDKQAVRRLLGYLPQEFGFYPKVSAERMLDHLARLKGIADARARRELCASLLARTNLDAAKKRPLGTFSGGMKQRFGIAQALLGDPKLLIVDEPTAGLDPEERVRFHNLLAEIGENVIVLLSTHIVSDVSDLCSRMAVLHRGEVLLLGEPTELVKKLDGRVWTRVVGNRASDPRSRSVDKGELDAVRAAHFVLSTRLFAGKTTVRVLADARPGPDFEPAVPELDDAYFAAIHAPRAEA